MAKPSAVSKRVDQQRMSLAEYKKLPHLRNYRQFFKSHEKNLLTQFGSFNGEKALKRLRCQAKVEGISPLEKLCRLERLSKKK